MNDATIIADLRKALQEEVAFSVITLEQNQRLLEENSNLRYQLHVMSRQLVDAGFKPV